MSAWIVSSGHIDVLVWALGVRELFPEGTTGPDEVGRLLWEENFRSVNYRYDEDEKTPAYTYRVPPVRWSPDQLTRIVGCYQYQSCEHPEWETSLAFRLTDDLYQALLREGADVDSAEADTAPWGICHCGGTHPDWQHDEAQAEAPAGS